MKSIPRFALPSRSHMLVTLTVISVFAIVGCSPKVETAADGTPEITLTPRDVAPPIEIFTNTTFEGEMTSEMANGKAVVRFKTNDTPGVTSLRIQLTPAAINKLRALFKAVEKRSFNDWTGNTHGKILVGSKTVYQSDDMRLPIGGWIASDSMEFIFKSPEEAQSVAEDLKAR